MICEKDLRALLNHQLNETDFLITGAYNENYLMAKLFNLMYAKRCASEVLSDMFHTLKSLNDEEQYSYVYQALVFLETLAIIRVKAYSEAYLFLRNHILYDHTDIEFARISYEDYEAVQIKLNQWDIQLSETTRMVFKMLCLEGAQIMHENLHDSYAKMILNEIDFKFSEGMVYTALWLKGFIAIHFELSHLRSVIHELQMQASYYQFKALEEMLLACKEETNKEAKVFGTTSYANEQSIFSRVNDDALQWRFKDLKVLLKAAAQAAAEYGAYDKSYHYLKQLETYYEALKLPIYQ